MKEVNILATIILSAIVGFIGGLIYYGVYVSKPCPPLKHEIGYTKIQYGIGVTCCNDTICIPEQNEFYRMYYKTHLTKDAKKVWCNIAD